MRAGASAVLLVPALAGCGGGGGPAATSVTGSPHAAGHRAGLGRGGAPAAFAWLSPSGPPHGWGVIRIPSGATLAFPPGWTRIRSDVGAASVALMGPRRRIVGYLNLTPQQGGETLANWATFRIRHNADEGDRHVTRLAAATDLRFHGGRGSCVRDSYSTVTGNRYIELACLVVGRQARTVIVAATTPADWNRIGPLLERAVSSTTT